MSPQCHSPFVTLTSALVAGTLVLGALSLSDAAPDPRPEPANPPEAPVLDEGKPRLDVELRTFMRRKLDASSKILEGLAIEDRDLVRQGAHTLAEMSTAEQWRVLKDPLYRHHSADFRETVTQLEKAAGEENLDRAALKWIDATMSCLECHRYVRGIRLADRP